MSVVAANDATPPTTFALGGVHFRITDPGIATLQAGDVVALPNVDGLAVLFTIANAERLVWDDTPAWACPLLEKATPFATAMLPRMAGISKPISKPAQATMGCIAHGLKRVRLQAGESQTVPPRTSTQQPRKDS